MHLLVHRAPAAQAQVDTAPPPQSPGLHRTPLEELALVIAWSAREPHRVGELARCVADVPLILGRAPDSGGNEQALRFSPHGCGGSSVELRSPAGSELLGEALSRRQLALRSDGCALTVRNIGRCPMWVNGHLSGQAKVVAGDTIHLQQQLLLLCVQRAPLPHQNRQYPAARLQTFGQPDSDGIVGESAAMWQLREQIATCAQTSGHVLVIGSSGSGKELVAQAIHRMSARSQKGLVAENIAAMPASLAAALLFGNRRNFPNPGMEERAGLIGLAEGGTLFLDEIGDMTAEVQPVFLRVLERGGEYLRLGDEAHPRKANVRVIGATNHPERLRIELRRRFHHEIVVPDLQQRTEDIPLLVNHILKLRAREHAGTLKYFCAGAPRIDPRLVEQLLRHRYSTHVSELSFLLQQAIEHSPDDVLMPISQATALTRVSLADAPASVQWSAQSVSPPSAAPASLRSLPSAEEAARALQTTGGCVVQTAMQLGITRHQLNRLIRKNGLTVERTSKRRAG